MKKNVFGRQFKRDVNERRALFKNLLTSLILEERIKTTEAKAKAIRGQAEKLVTKAKKGGVNVYKSLHPDINQEAVVKMIADIAPRFSTRQGGYTRIIRIGKRRVADNAGMVFLEWTENPAKQDNIEQKTKNIKKDNKKKATALNAAAKTKKAVKSEQVEVIKPVIGKKVEEKVQKQGFFKKLITRQKKGQ